MVKQGRWRMLVGSGQGIEARYFKSLGTPKRYQDCHKRETACRKLHPLWICSKRHQQQTHKLMSPPEANIFEVHLHSTAGC